MSITDELRRWARTWRNVYISEDDGTITYSTNAVGVHLGNGSTMEERILAMADRIDGQAEGEYTRGYNAGFNAASAEVESADELRERIEREYVKMPCDADGAPIHIGDEMEGVDKYDTLKKVKGKVITVSFESDGAVEVAVRAWNSDGKSWHRAYLDPDASVYRHHHAPTVEDVLREFANKVCSSDHLVKGGTFIGLEDTDLLAEYANRLRLAGDAE